MALSEQLIMFVLSGIDPSRTLTMKCANTRRFPSCGFSIGVLYVLSGSPVVKMLQPNEAAVRSIVARIVFWSILVEMTLWTFEQCY